MNWNYVFMGLSAAVLVACNNHDLPLDYPEVAVSSSSVQVSSSSAWEMIDAAGNRYAATAVGQTVWTTQNMRLVDGDSGVVCKDSSAGACQSAMYRHAKAKTVCPAPWRLPTDADWRQLVLAAGKAYRPACATEKATANQLSSEAYRRFPGDTSMGSCLGEAGKVLKATTTWDSQSAGLDALGLKVLPEGYRDLTKEFLQNGEYAYFWSSDMATVVLYPEDSAQASSWYFTKSNAMVHEQNFREAWLSVRCVRDVQGVQ